MHLASAFPFSTPPRFPHSCVAEHQGLKIRSETNVRVTRSRAPKTRLQSPPPGPNQFRGIEATLGLAEKHTEDALLCLGERPHGHSHVTVCFCRARRLPVSC